MGASGESTSQAMKQARTKRFLARFLGDRSGSTAIEFAALAIPFALLVFAILESCISFASQEVMANATDDVARQLRTGQIKAADLTDDVKLKNLICGELSIMAGQECTSRLSVDLRSYSTFADAAKMGFTITDGAVELTKNGKKDSKQFVVEPGVSTTKNMLRVFYRWPVITDFMAKSMANLDGNSTLHYASVTWQNEPFDD
jgi:Flp pilus assembly protein TadG